jgi:hypothetical protein
MLIVVRGTIWRDEWFIDFEYDFAEASRTQGLFPGRVHRGAFKLFSLYYQQIEEVRRGRRRPGHLYSMENILLRLCQRCQYMSFRC